ncbi:hypothetical protein [Aliikangiella sp. IMCC44632]
MKRQLIYIFILLISGCSTLKEKPVYEIGPEYFSSGVQVKDVLVGLFVKAPKVKVGISKAQLLSLLKASSGKVIANYDFVIVTEFSTSGSVLEGDYSNCHIAYGIESNIYKYGPKVIGACSNVKITGTREK